MTLSSRTTTNMIFPVFHLKENKLRVAIDPIEVAFISEARSADGKDTATCINLGHTEFFVSETFEETASKLGVELMEGRKC